MPAFVFRWIRETSATGFLRSGTNPRVRAQDGIKVPLLCEVCEQRFSRLERQFANEIFYPIQREKVREVEYDGSLLKFCASISWRVLSYVMQQTELNHLSDTQKRDGLEALKKWARFLLDEVPHPGPFEQRLVLLDAIADAPIGHQLQPNANRYFLRSVDVDVAATALTAFTFTKIGPFALFGMIDFDERWQGTKINANGGIVGPQTYELPARIFDYWMDRAKHHAEVYREIPIVQQEKLEAEIVRNPERFLKSGTFKAMEHDVRLFGRRAFRDSS